jgi:ectoine hydroxylase-related dioxygenase (phytanoyl-CoA dioxygenase family)
MLSPDQIAQYKRDGFVVVENILDETELRTARRIVAERLDGAHGLTGHTELYDLEPDHRPDAPRVRRLKVPHRWDPFFRNLVAGPKMLAAMQDVMGVADLRLTGSKINLKSPRGGSPVEWHQDWAFYPHTNDDLLAVGVMLDDCTLENGAMLAMPGSHRGPVHDHHVDGYFCGAIDVASSGMDFAEAVSCTGRAGSASFHHVRLVHGSAENVSTKPRVLLLYEVAAADAWPLMGVPDFADFNERLLSGSPSIVPRMADVPVRMPLPPAPNQGSIYENQTAAKSKFFGRQLATAK